MNIPFVLVANVNDSVRETVSVVFHIVRTVTAKRKRLKNNVVPSLNLPETPNKKRTPTPKKNRKVLRADRASRRLLRFSDENVQYHLRRNELEQSQNSLDFDSINNSNFQNEFHNIDNELLDLVSCENCITNDSLAQCENNSTIELSSIFNNNWQNEEIAAAEALLELPDNLNFYNDKAFQMESSSVNKAVQVNTFINLPKTTILEMLNTDAEMGSFCGLNSMIGFESLASTAEFYLVQIGYSRNLKVDIKTIFIICLIKLKLNISFACIAVLSGISSSSCLHYFYFGIKLLAILTQDLVPWPTKEDIKKNLPLCFAKFPHTRVIVDCSETPVETPTCLACRIKTYSHYKKTNTIKYLIGVSPNGLIIFYSKVYGGKISDKEIFNKSGLADKLDINDGVMVDKGFQIQEESNEHYFRVIQPPFLRGKKQFSKIEGILTSDIAQARIHVERTIQRIKVFGVFKKQFPWKLLSCIDDILTIVCGLVNLGHPTIADDKKKTKNNLD